MAKETIIYNCPNCGSSNTNKVSKSTEFCLECFIEFDKNGKMFTILYSGDLVDYYVNEFVNCG